MLLPCITVCTASVEFKNSPLELRHPGRVRCRAHVVIINFNPTKSDTFVRMIARVIDRLHSDNRPFSCNNVNIIIVDRNRYLPRG